MGDGRQKPPERAVNAFAARVIFMVFMRISKRMNRSGDPRGISPPPTTCPRFVSFVCFVVKKTSVVIGVHPWFLNKPESQVRAAARVEPRQPQQRARISCVSCISWFKKTSVLIRVHPWFPNKSRSTSAQAARVEPRPPCPRPPARHINAGCARTHG